ncbi:unnamed protein product [Strongylus vulgaris]|uniref:Uncharacterized protein n=1 Tax=Strongylus vulgaris TaxID=40348 RepID=A0A3P7LR49_STRVU|nr:unnamed protein product [Strongylus vulgaris]
MYDNCVNAPGVQVSTRFRLEYKLRTGKDLDVSQVAKMQGFADKSYSIPVQLSTVPCMNETAVTVYLNRADVRKALGIPTSLGPWAICRVLQIKIIQSPVQLSTVPCMNETAVTVYLNRADVRKALGIPTSLGPWAICSDTISNTYDRQYGEMASRVKNGLNYGLRGLIYSGDVDMACNFLMGQRFSRKLGYKVSLANYQRVVLPANIVKL